MDADATNVAIEKARKNIDKIEAARAKVKQKIQEWAEGFQAQHGGREPTTEDKAEVKHLYEKYKTLADTLAKYQQQLGSLQYSLGTGTGEDAERIEELEGENALLRERVKELEAELARQMSGSTRVGESMREKTLKNLHRRDQFVLEQEALHNDMDRQAYMEDKEQSLLKMQAYHKDLVEAGRRQHEAEAALREKDELIAELRLAATLQKDEDTGQYPIPMQWVQRREALAAKAKALEAGLKKAVRYTRPRNLGFDLEEEVPT